jgi:RNA polymerase sigma-70 factor (ECF subfamily)
VFVLRQAFAWTPEEIAEVLGRTPAAVRQLDHRARQHVAERRPRYGADKETARATAEAFLAACLRGDVSELLSMLAPEVVLHSDAGGEAKAPLRPIVGAHKVATFLGAIGTTPLPGVEFSITPVNGRPGIVATGPQGPFSSMSLDVDEHGRITSLYMMAAPSKLSHVADPVA